MISGTHRLTGLHPGFREYIDWLLDICSHYGVPVTITSGYRSIADQERVCAELRARAAREGKPASAYPCATPGLSAHQWGLAVDLMGGRSFNSPEHKWVIELGVAMGLRTVANDPPHLEHPQWRQILPLVRQQLRK